MNLKSSREYIDELTNLYNRYYLKKIQRELIKIEKFSLVWIDIDFFKEINDNYGHYVGDKVLKKFSQFLKTCFRTKDILIRYGGDEFICIMPHSDKKNTLFACNRILKKIREQVFSGIKLTVSIGISSYPEDGKNLNELIKFADEDMYAAKRSGRNRISGRKNGELNIPSITFVGRLDEKTALKEFLGKSSENTALFLNGYVGIGKTRLVREVLKDTKGIEILWADCSVFKEKIPYYPIRELIKYRINRQGDKVLSSIPYMYKIELGKLVPEIMPEKYIEKIDNPFDRFRLYEAVRIFLQNHKRNKIIVIDNFQWADDNSIEIIEYLLKTLKDIGLKFIFITRKEEKEGNLSEMISSISREIKITEIELPPLKKNEIRELVKAILEEKLDDKIFSYIESETGGNPLYIEELIKNLFERGFLLKEGENWKFIKPEIEIIPKNIEEIITKKYESLSNEAKGILDIGSLVGYLDIEMIMEITGFNRSHILGLIDNIKKLGIVKEEDNKIKFKDQITLNILFNRNKSKEHNIILHNRIADILEERYKGKENIILDELAFHYYFAGNKEKGVKYCIKAGDKAREQYANDTAIKYYECAIELLKNDENDDSKNLMTECLIKISDILILKGDCAKAQEKLDDALKLTLSTKNRKNEAEISIRKTTIYIITSHYEKAFVENEKIMKIYKEINDKLGITNSLYKEGEILWRMGKFKNSIKSFKKALKIAKEEDDKLRVANIYNHMGIVFFEMKDYASALKSLRLALGKFVYLRKKREKALVFNNLSLVYGDMGQLKTAKEYYEKSLKIFSSVGDIFNYAKVLNNIAIFYLELGNYSHGIKISNEANKIFSNIKDRYGEGLTILNISIGIGNLGEYREALKKQLNALKIFQSIKSKFGEGLALNTLGNTYSILGENELAIKCFKDAYTIGKSINSPFIEFESIISLGDFYLSMHRFTQAKKLLDKGINIAKRIKTKRFMRSALFLLCEYQLEKEDYKKCKTSLFAFEKFVKQMGTKGFLGHLYLFYGRYYTGIGDFKKAEKSFKDALKIFNEMKEKLNIGITYYYLGVLNMYFKNESLSLKYFNKCRKIFEIIEAKNWLKKLEEVLKDKR